MRFKSLHGGKDCIALGVRAGKETVDGCGTARVQLQLGSAGEAKATERTGEQSTLALRHNPATQSTIRTNNPVGSNTFS